MAIFLIIKFMYGINSFYLSIMDKMRSQNSYIEIERKLKENNYL